VTYSNAGYATETSAQVACPVHTYRSDYDSECYWNPFHQGMVHFFAFNDPGSETVQWMITSQFSSMINVYAKESLQTVWYTTYEPLKEEIRPQEGGESIFLNSSKVGAVDFSYGFGFNSKNAANTFS